jgi:hypothetical protein
MCPLLERRMLWIGVAPVPKHGYVAPSREGLVPVTVYVKPEVRQALKIAAAQHNITVSEILDAAITGALKKYAKLKD